MIGVNLSPSRYLYSNLKNSSLHNFLCHIQYQESRHRLRIFRSFSSTVSHDTSPGAIPKISDELKKRIFNTTLWETDPTVSFVRRKRFERVQAAQKLQREHLQAGTPTRSICLKYLEESTTSVEIDEEEAQEEEIISFPFEPKLINDDTFPQGMEREGQEICQRAETAAEERIKKVETWLSDFEFFSEKSSDFDPSDKWKKRYGTSDPSVPVSQVPCGGCGALLHCKEPFIPGYLPKEIFWGRSNAELRSLLCQRCHFLKDYKIALDVRVSPAEYPKILSQIKNKRAIAILMVDLLDFPCSIWPGIMDIIGTHRPVVVVGNKIDLIPGDHEGYLTHITELLQQSIEKQGIARANIKLTTLISAQTGFGIEYLITKLHQLWHYKSDVYLIGCTNVGKSTLFNALLQSDFCKVQAVDLVRRATTSVWPGTTLNLLKFPILRPEGWKLALRQKRLLSSKQVKINEAQLKREQLNRRKMFCMPSLHQRVERTFVKAPPSKVPYDIYSDDMKKPTPDEGLTEVGINENDPNFALGRWCYDTPGVMHDDQILNLLTTEELMKVLPFKTIIPRFFSISPGKSIFLGGLGRLDYTLSSTGQSARFGVFSSECLPVTISATSDADEVFKELLGSSLMAVPFGGSKRLSEWPGLQSKEDILTVVGLNSRESCADIVLSSAGWISICGEEGVEMSFNAWTPHARGIYVRQPSLLPFAVNFKGKRIDHTPTYHATVNKKT